MAFTWVFWLFLAFSLFSFVLAIFAESGTLFGLGVFLLGFSFFAAYMESESISNSNLEKKATAALKVQGFNIAELDADENSAVVQAGDCMITMRFQEPATLLIDGKNGVRYKFTPAMANAIAETCQP